MTTPMPNIDRPEIWADIERTLRGVIDDGLSAELDELDAALLLELVECRPPKADTSDDVRAAARYRWLRQQHWNEAPLAVVVNPKLAIRLGHDAPSLERLDEAIDAAIEEAARRALKGKT